MRRKWFIASWLVIAIGAIAVAGIAFRGSAGSAAAATQRFGPKQADVTTEEYPGFPTDMQAQYKIGRASCRERV